MPDATLLKACGNRRASACSSCSATYQADSFHLIAAGLRGGKGVPEQVARHPRLFVTFTAPSFGPVNSRRAQGRLVFPCHPYRQGQCSPHGKRVGCWQRHDEDDPRLGEPLCVRCYQAGAQVLWNALAGRLWSRTTVYLYRTLAKAAGMTEAELRRQVRISFAKVAEYQKRGAVHFHAVIRLDARTACGCPACVLPPPEEFSAALLEAAVKEAAAPVAVACPAVDDHEVVKAAWEAGHDHVVLIHGARAARDPRSELVMSGYGGIKWSLRAMLKGGDFDPYAQSPSSPLHRRQATRLIIALEPQPRRHGHS